MTLLSSRIGASDGHRKTSGRAPSDSCYVGEIDAILLTRVVHVSKLLVRVYRLNRIIIGHNYSGREAFESKEEYTGTNMHRPVGASVFLRAVACISVHQRACGVH